MQKKNNQITMAVIKKKASREGGNWGGLGKKGAYPEGN